MSADRVLGVDVGGTFTDLVLWDGEHITTGKVATTPDQSEGVVSGALEVAPDGNDRFLHGTTVATNALLERKGARTALITTEGFADVIEIGRQNRPSLYDGSIDRPEPLVPRDRRFVVPRRDPPNALPHERGGGGPERSEGVGGGVVLPNDVLSALAGTHSRQPTADGRRPSAVAISLLYGYALHDQEAAIAEAIRELSPELSVALSSEVAPEFREFERTSTTVLNAYLMPLLGKYLNRLVTRAADAGLPGDIAVMRSSGGLLPISEVAALPVAALLSGPAGGVVAAAALGDSLGKARVVSFDMGGTSTDVCRIEGGRPEITYGREIGGYPCLQPATAIHTVGAGGGSIAWVDSGGSLRVGPHSAGADPGPACYDRGGDDATVTDANIALARIDPDGSLAGRLPLRADLAERALSAVGDRVDLDRQQTALGVVQVVEEVMAGALRRVSIEQGSDPREAVLVAFGGAGGLHATALARRLDMSGVLIPAHAGVFSALGLLLSPPRVDESQTVMLREHDLGRLDRAIGEVGTAVATRLRDTTGEDGAVVSFVDTRYHGQAHELAVRYDPGDGWDTLADRFHRLHYERNGFSRPHDPIEAVTVRAEGTGSAVLAWDELPPVEPVGDASAGAREILTDDGPVTATVYRRSGLQPGDEIVGPAVVEETEATTYLGAGERAAVDDSGALEVEW